MKTNEIAVCKKKNKRNNLNYETNKDIDFDFQQFKTMRSFGESIIGGKFTISEVDEDQRNLLENIVEFYDKSGRRTKENKMKKRNTFDRNALYG